MAKPTDITNESTLILSQLLDDNSARKSHQLIRLAMAAAKQKLTPGQWMNIIDTLVHRGLLTVDLQRTELELSPRGRAFLTDERELFADIDQPAPILPPEVQPNFDETLYNRLRYKRRVLAEEEDIPVYMIFSNRSLAEMATYRPETMDELKSLHGVGDQLSARYGQTFLTAIRYYLKSVA